MLRVVKANTHLLFTVRQQTYAGRDTDTNRNNTRKETDSDG